MNQKILKNIIIIAISHQIAVQHVAEDATITGSMPTGTKKDPGQAPPKEFPRMDRRSLSKDKRDFWWMTI